MTQGFRGFRSYVGIVRNPGVYNGTYRGIEVTSWL